MAQSGTSAAAWYQKWYQAREQDRKEWHQARERARQDWCGKAGSLVTLRDFNKKQLEAHREQMKKVASGTVKIDVTQSMIMIQTERTMKEAIILLNMRIMEVQLKCRRFLDYHSWDYGVYNDKEKACRYTKTHGLAQEEFKRLASVLDPRSPQVRLWQKMNDMIYHVKFSGITRGYIWKVAGELMTSYFSMPEREFLESLLSAEHMKVLMDTDPQRWVDTVIDEVTLYLDKNYVQANATSLEKFLEEEPLCTCEIYLKNV